MKLETPSTPSSSLEPVPQTPSTSSPTPPPTDKHPRGRSRSPHKEKQWMASDKDMDSIPENKMYLVIPALMLVLFLAALDTSIITTALPTIVSDLGGTPAQYSWVGTSYLLVCAIMVPVWGRVSDIIGRKQLLLPAIIVFMLGSGLCGGAKTMNWLIAARAVQGLGGGAILSLTQIIVGDIVPLRQRGAFNSFFGAVWGIASVLGPVFGGLICNDGAWPWAFFLNLPICAIAFPALWFSLKLNPTKKTSWSQLAAKFDFIGLVLLMGGVACLVVGFAFASDHGWGDKATIALLVVGVVAMASSGVNFFKTKRNAIIPKRVLTTRTTVLCMVVGLLHSSSFLAATFYIPVFFQGVQGASPLMSGIYVMPFSLIVSLGTVVAGQMNTRLKMVRPIITVGYGLAALGFGLFIKYLAWDSSVASQIAVPGFAGIGIGLALGVPLLAMQAAMPLNEMAATTSAWLLVRSLGGTMGIAIFQAVITNGLNNRFPKLEGYGTLFDIPRDLDGYHRIHALPNGPVRDGALQAFSESLRICYYVWTAEMGFAFLLSLLLKHYTLERTQGSAKPVPNTTSEDPTSNESEYPDADKAADLEKGYPVPTGGIPPNLRRTASQRSEIIAGGTPLDPAIIAIIEEREEGHEVERGRSDTVGSELGGRSGSSAGTAVEVDGGHQKV